MNMFQDDSQRYLSLIAIVVVALILWYIVFKYVGKKKVQADNIFELSFVKKVLGSKVKFYEQLNEAQQSKFIDRVAYFLKTTKISGEKGAVVTEEDKILVAASATIPLFHFDAWNYDALDEVIVYPDYFDDKFDTEEGDRMISGMVGSGSMSRKMILSQNALRSGFNEFASGNTGIHEFVHLIDSADGATDGVPEYLIPKSIVKPWLDEMHKTIVEIQKGKSDIRNYATTNSAEFLAVVSEYFFQKPHLLEEHHPELYQLLREIYMPDSSE